MRNSFILDEEFLTNQELSFKGNIIPENTLFQIIETECGEQSKEYKVYFKNGDNEENIQVLNFDEIEEIRKSAMCEY